MPDFIQCDTGAIQIRNNHVRCQNTDNPVLLTEVQVIDLYSPVEQFDQAAYLFVLQHALLLFMIAFGVKLIRKIMGN